MTLEEELLATEEDDVMELEDSSELELATELLDSSLDELRMTLLELGATLEEESSFSLEEEEDSESVSEMTLEEELRMILEDEESSSFDGPFVEPPSPQAASPKAKAKAPTAIALNPKFDFILFTRSLIPAK